MKCTPASSSTASNAFYALQIVAADADVPQLLPSNTALGLTVHIWPSLQILNTLPFELIASFAQPPEILSSQDSGVANRVSMPAELESSQPQVDLELSLDIQLRSQAQPERRATSHFSSQTCCCAMMAAMREGVFWPKRWHRAVSGTEPPGT